MSSFILYLILILDNFRDIIWLIFGLSLIYPALCLICGTIAAIASTEPDYSRNAEEKKTSRINYSKEQFNRVRKGLLYPLIVLLVIGLMPSTKQAAVIVVLPTIVNNETVQQEAKELYDLAKGWLKEQVNETSVEVKGNKE